MKSGLEYFPLDCNIDDKLELIEAEFGITGFGVVVKLFQKIYGGQGYYTEWTNEVALLFSRRIGLGGSVVSEIVSAAINRGIFSKEHYEKYSILTSRGIQKRYLEAVVRRKNVSMKKEYLLIEVTPIYKNVDILSENVCKKKKNANISKQSKVEESKVEESKESADKPHRFTPPAVDEVASYCRERNNNIDAQHFIDFYSAKNWYIGKNKMSDWKASVRTWEKRNTQQNQPKPSNFKQRDDTDFDDLEKNILKARVHNG